MCRNTWHDSCLNGDTNMSVISKKDYEDRCFLQEQKLILNHFYLTTHDTECFLNKKPYIAEKGTILQLSSGQAVNNNLIFHIVTLPAESNNNCLSRIELLINHYLDLHFNIDNKNSAEFFMNITSSVKQLAGSIYAYNTALQNYEYLMQHEERKLKNIFVHSDARKTKILNRNPALFEKKNNLFFLRDNLIKLYHNIQSYDSHNISDTADAYRINLKKSSDF